MPCGVDWRLDGTGRALSRLAGPTGMSSPTFPTSRPTRKSSSEQRLPPSGGRICLLRLRRAAPQPRDRDRRRLASLCRPLARGNEQHVATSPLRLRYRIGGPRRAPPRLEMLETPLQLVEQGACSTGSGPETSSLDGSPLHAHRRGDGQLVLLSSSSSRPRAPGVWIPSADPLLAVGLPAYMGARRWRTASTIINPWRRGRPFLWATARTTSASR